ncbi:hypothetical protein MRX96_027625 [Rhipicephalus microplus]
MTAHQSKLANGWKYTLTGFGEFLEMRRVAFAEPIPTTRLCGVCGLLPCHTWLLPCCHVLCVSCRDLLPRGDDCRCPFDGKKFSGVHQMTVEIEKRRILCSARSEVCGFSVTLHELSDHLTSCCGVKLQCKFTKDGNITNAALALFLRDGEWDIYLDWPFGKKVVLTIMRARNPAKYIRLPDIELQGHVDRGALYVNVEFE